MDEEKATTWPDYEEVSRHILEQLGDLFGLELQTVEGKQKLRGASGVLTEIDAKGVKVGDGAIVVIECKELPTSRVNLDDVRALAYKIGDLGSSGGIIVTPLGLQRGAAELAKYEGIKEVHLAAHSSVTDFRVQFLEQVVYGRSAHVVGSATLTATAVALPGPGQTAADVPSNPQPGASARTT